MTNDPLESFEDELKQAGFKEIPASELPPALLKMLDDIMDSRPSIGSGEDTFAGAIQACILDMKVNLSPEQLDDIKYLSGFLRGINAVHALVKDGDYAKSVEEIHLYLHCKMAACDQLIKDAKSRAGGQGVGDVEFPEELDLGCSDNVG